MAITVSLILVPLIVLLGGAVDLMRYASVKSEIQGAIDSGILDIARVDNFADPEVLVKEYIAANADPALVDASKVDVVVQKTVDESGTEVSVASSYEMPTYFMHLIGIKTLKTETISGGKQEWQAVEVSLVVDISSSMNNNRLANLEAASNEFIDLILTDDVLDITSISLVPFGGTVKLPDYMKRLVDPAGEDTNDDTDYRDGHRWHGCIELRPEDFSDDDFGDDETYQIVPHFWKFRNFNPWCPEDGNESIFLSNDRTELKNLVSRFSRSDGTGMDIGAAFGLKALSPNLRGKLGGDFSDRPSAYNDGVLKVLVMMTDGGITNQARPRNVGCIRARNNQLRYNTTRLCDAQLYASTDPTNPYSNSGNSHSSGRAVSYFESICDEAKSHNILIYTVGFEIRSGSRQDQYLRECATSISHYYFVESTDIVAAFESIAANINSVRLSQ